MLTLLHRWMGAVVAVVVVAAAAAAGWGGFKWRSSAVG